MSDTATPAAGLKDHVRLPSGEPAIVPFAELSRLMLVGIDANQGNHLLWTAQTSPDGPWSGTWAPVNESYSYMVLGTGSTMDGRVAMAALTKSAPATVHYIDEAQQGPGGAERWNGPVDLGLPGGVTGFVQLAMQRDANGRVEIFGVDGTTGGVWWIYQNPARIIDITEEVTPPGSTTPITVHVQVPAPPVTPWSAWTQLPGDGLARMTVVNDVNGRITIVATGQDPQAAEVYVNAQTADTALTAADWTGWTRIDNAASGTAGSLPTAVLDRAGFLNIFMVGVNAQIVQIRQTEPAATTWSAWHQVSMIGAAVVNVTSAFDGDGDIVLVALDENLGLHANYQTEVQRQVWSGWQQIGVAPGFGLAAMDYNADGSLSYFQGENRIDGVKFISQVAPDSTHWTAGWTMLADNGIFTYGIVRDLTPPATS
ncbi:hypothetical protein DFR52_104138 [Hoeflea marina]|uniref:PLL-like beta propeller domain-containing protein n=1 Tax=Hoeflea marina TaxID=274592 RepID=A0A317PHC4_9HYPH|nr:hypothetical protein [Hoeflea marina]PWV98848.1 hypothetical protein DFR52_104138 [Hoeflea marina]